jgi:hypothetical protein
MQVWSGGQMGSLENRLAAIGYRVERRAADCWRVEYVGPSAGVPAGRSSAPVRSRALALWLDRLRDRPQPAAYRICLASETG